MADTLQNIEIPADEWVELYTETGVATTSRLEVQNIGVSDLYLTVSATPPDETTGYRVLKREGASMINDADDVTLWVMSPNRDGLINVRAS